MAKRKEAPKGIAVYSEKQAIEVAKRNARWKGIPPAFQLRQGDEDSHELHDALTPGEQLDAVRFRQGDMQLCCFSQAVQIENEEERLAQIYA